MFPLIACSLVLVATSASSASPSELPIGPLADPDCPKPIARVNNGCCEPLAHAIDLIAEIVTDCLEFRLDPLPSLGA